MYCTRYFQTTDEERLVMQLRRKRINAPLMQVLAQLALALENDPNELDMALFVEGLSAQIPLSTRKLS